LSDAVPFKDEILASVQELPNDVILVQTTELDLDVCQKALDTLSQKHASNAPIATTDTPEVASHNNVLTPFECDYLITISCSLMQPSKVVSADKAGSVQQGYRTSDGAVLLPHMLDLPTVRIIEKLAEISGIDASHGEFLSLLRYKPGQEYRPHHDFLQVDENDYSMIGRCGQRCATLLTYLNEGFEGGETEFPALEFQYEGRTGSSLYFRNTDRAGKPIQDSLHAGLPIIKGEKWMATLWIRERPFWPWARTP
jgi:prolyl 4-hydroxylase